MYQEFVEKRLGRNRQLVTALDVLRASEFVNALLSGTAAYTGGSGVLLFSGVLSSIVAIRPVNIHLHNRETSHVTVLFRDGSVTGGIVAGPYIVNPSQGRDIAYDELLGRRFLSGIFAAVISGTFGQGTDVNIGYIKEPDPTAVGGYLE